MKCYSHSEIALFYSCIFDYSFIDQLYHILYMRNFSLLSRVSLLWRAYFFFILESVCVGEKGVLVCFLILPTSPPLRIHHSRMNEKYYSTETQFKSEKFFMLRIWKKGKSLHTTKIKKRNSRK